MRRLPGLLLAVFCLFAMPAQADEGVRFTAVDIVLDSPQPLAAWQFRLSDRNALMTVVGVESGDSDRFSDAPYYDREGVASGAADRIIVADFSLAEESRLPTGRIRLATLHLMITGSTEPDYELQLVTATTHDGVVIDASISLDPDTGRSQ